MESYFSKEQMSAIRSLERAFKKCEKSNLNFAVVAGRRGFTLYTFDELDSQFIISGDFNYSISQYLDKRMFYVDCCKTIVECGGL